MKVIEITELLRFLGSLEFRNSLLCVKLFQSYHGKYDYYSGWPERKGEGALRGDLSHCHRLSAQGSC